MRVRRGGRWWMLLYRTMRGYTGSKRKLRRARRRGTHVIIAITAISLG